MALMVNQILLNLLEKGINQVILMDSEAIQKIAALEGKIIAIQATQPSVLFFILPTSTGLFLTSHLEPSINSDVKITATIPLLLRLLLTKEKQTQLKNNEIMLVGEVSVAYQLFNILDELDLNWEEALSQWIGAAPTAVLINSIRRGDQHLQTSLNTLKTQLSELIQHPFVNHSPLENIIDLFQKKFRQP